MTDPGQIEIPPTIERKDYQIDALRAVVGKWEAGLRSVLMIMPTGTGKTIASGLISKYALEEYGREILFIAHRTELIEQATNTFVAAFGFTTAVEMGTSSERDFVRQHGQRPEVVVATVQSLHGERLADRFARDRFGLIVVDEAHHSSAGSYGAVLDYFRDYLLLGITATPDGAAKDLAGRYESIAYQLRLRTAIEDGHLVRPRTRRIRVPVDLRDIRTTGGDFNLGDVAERIGPAIEILCEQVHANVGERKTVIFTPDVGSAQAIADVLRQMGRRAVYVAGQGGKFGISRDDRKERLDAFRAGEHQVIACCDLLVEGWDMPAVSCVVIARPTQKRHRYAQMVGRGLRLHPGKVDCLLLDLDWRQDDTSRRLCMPHELFSAGDENPDALEVLGRRTRERAADGAADRDILDELREIESDLHHARLINIKYTGKFAELYECVDSTPFGVGKVLDIRVRKSKDFDPYRCGPATPFQVEKLQRLGVAGAASMNLWGASRLIGKLEGRDRKGLASHQQVKELLSHGVGEQQARTATRKEAAAIIADLILRQGEMF